MHQYGAAQEQVNVSHVVNFVIPVPPLHEQRTIVNILNEQVQQLDNLAVVVHQQVDLMAERRQALITAAVTGQIDVRR
jgi:type I restriction enzyme S subunit